MPADRDARRVLALICAPGSLVRLEKRLRSLGWRVLRIDAIRFDPVIAEPPDSWLGSRLPADVWVVTSRAVPLSFLPANPGWTQPLRKIPRVVAVGADTAAALRRAGFRGVVAAPTGGKREVLKMLGTLRGRRILYLRSDRAGRDFARSLRERGARVRERLAYRVRQGTARRRPPPLAWMEAPVWVVSSPSALLAWQKLLGAAGFRKAAKRVHAYAMGPTTARAARRLGVGWVAHPRRSDEEGFTRFLAEALAHGALGRPAEHPGGGRAASPAAS